jgi:50S ribosomal protein L17
LGDNAEMALIELVDYNEAGYSPKGTAKKKSTRRSRGGKKAAAEQAAPEAKEGNSSEA